jgi:hypothetical protein
VRRTHAEGAVQAEEVVSHLDRLIDRIADDAHRAVLQRREVGMIVHDEASEHARLVQLQIGRAQGSDDTPDLRHRVVVEDPVQASHLEVRRRAQDAEGIDEGAEELRPFRS